MKKNHWKCALIEIHSYWLHVLRLHSWKSTFRNHRCRRTTWKQNNELTLQCCLCVQCEAGFIVVVNFKDNSINAVSIKQCDVLFVIMLIIKVIKSSYLNLNLSSSLTLLGYMFLLSSQFSSYFTFVVLAGGVPNGTDSRGDGVFPGSGGQPMLILERHFYIRCDSWPKKMSHI